MVEWTQVGMKPIFNSIYVHDDNCYWLHPTKIDITTCCSDEGTLKTHLRVGHMARQLQILSSNAKYSISIHP